MVGQKISSNDIKTKDIISVPLSFVDKETGKVTRKMNRPCLVINTTDELIKCRTITSQTNKYVANLYGVKVLKREENGLKKDSSVLCTKDNEVILRKNELSYLKKLGAIEDQEMVSVLKKVTMCNRKHIQTRYTVNKGMKM